ncbi:hypothetical protein [Flavobacterium columnare]|uniref:hypothetical protein n=1 Tax=Flavobacterium columnare TaxID=996 RepID=UPI0018967F13|nr:hypothetical protein [Flavobacterium columnare]MBF6657717.1 hypothetical protein [Flavobacterium columnare]
MNIKNYIESKEFLDLKQTCINVYLEYKEKSKIGEFKKVFESLFFEIILTDKFLYELVPFNIELSKQKKGKILKKMPNNRRYVENFFLDNELYAQRWEIQGNKELFGSYINLSITKENFKEIYFIQIDKEDNFNDLISYTRIFEVNDEIFYLTISGLKETNWYLRIDSLKNKKIDRISRFDPAFNLETTFNIEYLNDNPVSIMYNDSIYFSIT